MSLSSYYLYFLLFFSFYFSCLSSLDPYFNNGGNIIGITGKNFVLIASDNYYKPSPLSTLPTSSIDSSSISSFNVIKDRELIPRLSKIFNFKIRNYSKKKNLFSNSSILLSSYGSNSDFIELKKKLILYISKFNLDNKNQSIFLNGFVNVLSLMLYSRRSFPYYCFCLVGGINKEGQGELYRYDPLGSFEKTNKACLGENEEIFQPFLDSLDKEIYKNKTMEWKTSLFHDSFDDTLSPLRVYSESSGQIDSSLSMLEFLTPNTALHFTQQIFKIAAKKNKNFGDQVEIYLIVSHRDENSDEVNTITKRFLLPIK